MSGNDAAGVVLRPLLQAPWKPLALAALLAVLGLGAGAGLVAYSGLFITATAVAGASGLAATFEIFRPGALIRLLALVRTTARYGERLLGHDAILRLLAALRLRVFEHLVALAPQPLARWSDGDLLQRLTADIDTLDEAPLRAGLPLLAGYAVAAGICLLAWSLATGLGLVVTTGLLLAAVLVPLASARHGRRQNDALLAQTARRRAHLVDGLRCLTTLSLSGAWPQWRAQWKADDDRAVALQLQLRLRETLGQAAVVAVIGLTTAAALWLAQQMAALPATSRVGVVLAVVASLEAIAPCAGALLAWGRSRAALARVQALLGQEPVITFRAAAATPPPRGEVSVHDAAYRHAGRRAGLAALSLQIDAGARVLVRGVSGAGKSTLVALLTRQLDPQQGRVLLDGVDLRDYDEASLRARIACLPQRPHLFAASLAQNLRLADPAADDTRLRAVLQAVDLGGWLETLPQGLDTMIGEYGLGLSGGEARRVALAACLLRPAVVYVLDEPFEGLDAATRERVVAGLQGWIGAATLIVCSHQPAALRGTVLQLHLHSDNRGEGTHAQ